MPTCQHCGADIEFRYIDGKCRPIHPDGGWHCGTWVHSDSGSGGVLHRREATTWNHENFTRPTKCPKCHRDVFFIRHNDGSVWVDELCWPWPKHACFDEPHAVPSVFHGFFDQLAKINKPDGGIVTCIRPSLSGETHFIEVTYGNGDKIGFFLAWMPPQNTLLGALVVISRQDHLLIHPLHGEIAMHDVVDLSPRHAVKQHSAGTSYQTADGQNQHQKEYDCEADIVSAIRLIAEAAWGAAANAAGPNQIKVAQQVALGLIADCPPKIHEEVRVRLTRNDWAFLLAQHRHFSPHR